METAFFIVAIVIFLAIFGALAVKKVRNQRSVEGTVDSKRYEPARTVTRTRNRHQSSHQRSFNRRHNRMPDMDIETRTIPEKWFVTIKPSDGSSKVTREVSEQVYDELRKGDLWSDENPPE